MLQLSITPELLKEANIGAELVQEVLQASGDLLSRLGYSASASTANAYIHAPNDDLYIDVSIKGLTIVQMNELNEKWLNTVINHDFSHPFAQISRVMINFRPASE